MSGSKLDQIVKGAPPPGTSVPAIVSSLPSSPPSPVKQEEDAEPSAPAAPTATSRAPIPTTTIPSSSLSSSSLQPTSAPDPLTILPSSPSQIYLNLLILEASLRSQYLHLRDRRRQNTFFLLLLSLWHCFFTYLLFMRPREDGSGVGGSVYWVVEMAEKVALMGSIVTALLIWGTGQWERGIRWPRRWVGVANRGLRVVNAKIVVIKGPWWSEQLGGWLGVLFPYSAFFPPTASVWGGGYLVEGEGKRDDDDGEYPLRDEDLSPGGDHIKLLLLPKPFSPDFRENWELYRSEYWEKENERRARLRAVLKKRQRDWAKKQRGWLWWTLWRRPSSRHGPEPGTSGRPDGEKSHHHHHHNQHQQQRMGEKHRRSSGTSDTHSRTSSRSSTPSSVFEQDGGRPGTKSRRGSSATTTGNTTERRRKLRVSGSSSAEKEFSKLTPISRPA